jgi:hypothetical protein
MGEIMSVNMSGAAGLACLDLKDVSDLRCLHARRMFEAQMSEIDIPVDETNSGFGLVVPPKSSARLVLNHNNVALKFLISFSSVEIVSKGRATLKCRVLFVLEGTSIACRKRAKFIPEQVFTVRLNLFVRALVVKDLAMQTGLIMDLDAKKSELINQNTHLSLLKGQEIYLRQVQRSYLEILVKEHVKEDDVLKPLIEKKLAGLKKELEPLKHNISARYACLQKGVLDYEGEFFRLKDMLHGREASGIHGPLFTYWHINKLTLPFLT